ncbi:hypothetical protein BWGOE5_33830 [Bacillus mycoides]|uniref:insecticidal delta-endotoxin Cry8Ea1 family protein n=1 Tax=Bacillus mycoides TaxID=1405 RepID=UPI000863D421|nr:insecticidal delta-endotoxin Cry8Ea1 family protein [Bacillus mycoides]OHX30682.1 hypothetical protein BWGOE5_33830 [Bacillus mycoides]SCM87472.1 Protein of unknown function [Bacillus mycoides]
MNNSSILLELIEKGLNDGNDILSLLSFIGMKAIEAIPVVGGTISSLISLILFPFKSKVDYREIWNQLKKSIEQLVDRKITEALMTQLMQEITGFAAVLDEYRDAYDLYNGNKVFNIPSDMTPGDHLNAVFVNSNIKFIQRMQTFQNPAYDVVFLPFSSHQGTSYS